MIADTDAPSAHPTYPSESGQERNAARLALIRWIAEQLVDRRLAEATAQPQEAPHDENRDLR